MVLLFSEPQVVCVAIRHIDSMIHFCFDCNVSNKYEEDIIEIAKCAKYQNVMAECLPSVCYDCYYRLLNLTGSIRKVIKCVLPLLKLSISKKPLCYYL